MAASEVDLSAEQNATFRAQFQLLDASNAPIDITGCTAKMQIRTAYTASSVIALLTDANSDITLGGTNGTIALYLPATSTLKIPVNYSEDANMPVTQYVYDLFLTYPSGDSERIVYGKFIMSGVVTRV